METVSKKFIPETIKELAARLKAVVEVTEPPGKAERQELGHLDFARIRLRKAEKIVEVDLLRNNKLSPDFKLIEVQHEQHTYSEDDYGDALAKVIEGIFEGRVHEKRGLFGKRRVYILDSDGNKYWPRT